MIQQWVIQQIPFSSWKTYLAIIASSAVSLFLQELEDHDWLDVNSRAVFLEFTVYNANVNLFGSVIMLIEFMSTGGAVTRAEVKVGM